MLKNSIKILTIVALFILFSSCFNSVDAYNIEFKAKAKDLDPENPVFSDVVYRICEPPAGSTITWFNSAYKNPSDGWAYMEGSNRNQKYMVLRPNGSGGYILPGSGTHSGTYRQWSTIFHPTPNTRYRTDKGTQLSYVTYRITPEQIVNNNFTFPTTVTKYGSAYDETYTYKGLYDAPHVDGNKGTLHASYNENNSGVEEALGIYEILNTKDSLWRCKIVNNVLVSDRVITSNQLSEMYKLFAGTIDADNNEDGYSDNMIYMSNVNYSDKRQKASTKTMDTAYKFASRKPLLVSYGKSSVINTYDNKLIFPEMNTTKTNIYIRHIDVTDIMHNEMKLNLTNINGLASISEETAKKDTNSGLNRVGFIRRMQGNASVGQLNYTFGDRCGANAEEYQYYNNSLKDGQSYIVASQKSEKLNLVGTVVGIGNTRDEAVANRDQKYQSMTSTEELVKTYEEKKEVWKQTTDKYVVIDFLYSAAPEEDDKPETVLLVRHINVSGITGKVSSDRINSIVKKEGRGLDWFLGRGKIINPSGKELDKSEQGWCYYYIPTLIMNESYTLKDKGQYKLYNNFYKEDSEDYEYIGYIQTFAKESPQEALNKRNKKIEDIDFSNNTGLDGVNSGGTKDKYVSINNDNNNLYILVDMYYRSKSVDIITPNVKGRLSFMSASPTFKKTTEKIGTNSGVYDYIPSGETMYADITGANKFMLGGIKVVPKTIENNQFVTITVNIPYSYNNSYWSSTSCKNNHGPKYAAIGDACKYEYEDTCTDEVTGEPYPCSYYCNETMNKNYTSSTGSGTLTAEFKYKIPYKYQYYKVSNIRTYKITHMELYDTDNEEDLRLFEGKIYNIPVTDTYKSSVKGKFTQSTSKQSITDSRSVYTIGVGSNVDEKGDTLTETVTLPSISYNETYDDKIYDSNGAISKINSKLDNVKSKLNHDNATKITSITNDGVISPTLDGSVESKVQIKFAVSSDKISAGNINLLIDESKKESERAKDNDSKTIKLTGAYKYIDESTTSTGSKVEVSLDRPDNIYKQYGFSNPEDVRKTTISDFENEDLKISESCLNGERVSKAKIYYEIVADENSSNTTDDDKTYLSLNFDVSKSDQDSAEPHAWKRNSATANGDTFIDKDMNKDKDNEEEQQTRIVPGINLRRQITYNYTSSKTSESHGTGDIVNVFTPIKFGVSLTNVQGEGSISEIINHTNDANKSKNMSIIQKDTRFKIKISPLGAHKTYKDLPANKMNGYIKQYYIKFDNLDVQDVRYKASTTGPEIKYNDGDVIVSGEWIGPIPNIGSDTYITAITRDDPNEAGGLFKEESNSYTVRGVTRTATSLMLYDLASNTYANNLIEKNDSSDPVDESYNRAKGGYGTTQNLYHGKYYTKKKLYNDANYVSQTSQVVTQNLGRIYDFKVTDVKDLDWKDTFRKSTSSNTNVHSGTVYYSGVNKLNIYTTNFNDMIRRNADEIGASAEKTLPIGPYKNANTGYTYAPKLGYRFSFDFKSTGKAVNNKTANINVSFMFISKEDGKIDDEIDLYYKNSSGKYVKIGTSNDKMQLYFVPNDGYRLTFDEGTYNFSYSNLSSKTVKLGKLTELSLNKNMMATSDSSYSQIWYGEYKLPNSTIAVKHDETNLESKRLKNGYIAVKFDISVTDSNATIKYGQNNRDSNGNEIPNTSQWDYEGYLGYNGSTDNLKLRLDDGSFMDMNDEVYGMLKGTVILYDADARAANDYN